MKRNGHYWTEEDKIALKAAQFFPDLAGIALRVLARMPKPIAHVCGPISTGGVGSIKGNLAVFDATIDYLIAQGINVFDQVPFEVPVFRIIGAKRGSRENNMLLNQFYLPIFESGHVSKLYFIHGWESSEGANWEHRQAQRLGMEIEYLEPNLVHV
jgi:hypothetical protein